MTKTVLVVDDSVTDLANMKAVLTDAGCAVSTASNGKEAIAKAKAEKPAVVFLDIIMPEMDGYETCRQLAADPETKHIPVVFVTCKSQKADKLWGGLQGAVGYVTKPYKDDDLIDQVKAYGK
jgi:twitching motility two-component system response regulator PilH